MALTCLQPGPKTPRKPGDDDVKAALREFVEAFGRDRCGKDAMYRDELGRPTCTSCAAEMKRAHADGATLMSMLRAAPPRFTPIQ